MGICYFFNKSMELIAAIAALPHQNYIITIKFGYVGIS